jgi:hypothetical protein
MRTLTVPNLPYLLAQVADHQHHDVTLPYLAGIALEADTTHLYAIASDRFTLAAARTPLDPQHSADSTGFIAFLTSTDVKTVSALARATRTRTATLTQRTNTLAVRFGDHRLNLPHHPDLIGKLPQWRTLLHTALTSEPDLGVEIGLSPRLLARWSRNLHPADQNTPLIAWTKGPGEPLLIARGPDFLGAQMPVRLASPDTARADVRRDWLPALTPTTEAPRQVAA